MSWIELHQSVLRHPKTIRLAASLGKPRQFTVGVLAELWCWALDAAEEGGPLTAPEVAAGADWPGNATKFAEALTDAGYLDRAEDGRYWLHDWWDYAGRMIKKRADNRERMRNARAEHVQRTTSTQYANGATHVQGLPTSTKPAPAPTSTNRTGAAAAAPVRARDPATAMLGRLPDTGLRKVTEKTAAEIREWASAIPLGQEEAVVEFVWQEYTEAGGRSYRYLKAIMDRVRADSWQIQPAELEPANVGRTELSDTALKRSDDAELQAIVDSDAYGNGTRSRAKDMLETRAPTAEGA